EEVERPRVLDPALRLRKAESRRELRPESLALFRRHLAQLPLGPTERCREGQQLVQISEVHRERFRRRLRPVEPAGRKPFADVGRIPEHRRLGIVAGQLPRLPQEAELFRRRRGPVLRQELTGHPKRRRMVGWPLAEDEPTAGAIASKWGTTFRSYASAIRLNSST